MKRSTAVWKLVGSSGLLLALVLVVPLIVLPGAVMDSLREARKADLLQTGVLLAAGLDATLGADHAVGERLARAAVDDTELRSVTLWDARGEAVLSHGIAQQLTPSTQRPDQSVRIDGELAIIEVALGSTQHADWRLLATAPADGLAIQRFGEMSHRLPPRAGVMVLLWMVLISLVGGRVQRRLSALREAAEPLSEGTLNRAPLRDPRGDEIGAVADSLDSLQAQQRALLSFLERVADGDLAATLDLPGPLASAANRMAATQRQLVGDLHDTAVRLNTAAQQLGATARHQDGSAAEQSTALEETRRSAQSLLAATTEIGQHAGRVLELAEQTQTNSHTVAGQIGGVSSQAAQIAEIMELIKDISTRSDVLALNAALEGSRAGEAGRGFTHIARQMKNLAESVMESLRTIDELWRAISQATTASVLATEEATKLATTTTESARRISLILRQQRSGTEQVAQAVGQATRLAGGFVQGSREIVQATEDLTALADRLERQVLRFRLEQKGSRPQ